MVRFSLMEACCPQNKHTQVHAESETQSAPTLSLMPQRSGDLVLLPIIYLITLELTRSVTGCAEQSKQRESKWANSSSISTALELDRDQAILYLVGATNDAAVFLFMSVVFVFARGSTRP